MASLVISGLTLTMVPFNAFATGTMPTRLAGTTSAETAVAIADQTGWTGTAILAPSASYGMCDALSAGPLSSYLKAPILLQGPQDALDRDTKAELLKLNARTVYVTSGTAVIKQSVIDELKSMGIRVATLGGKDKYETSVNIAKHMAGVTKVAVANSIPDALSIAPIASANNEPILLTDKDVVPTSVAAYLAEYPDITFSDVIGGTGVISAAVMNKLPRPTRHFGNTAYDTNNQVIQDFNTVLKYDNVFIANGVTGIDALAGAPLAAQTSSPILLTDGSSYPTVYVYADKVTSASVLSDALNDTITVSLSSSDSPSSVTTALGGPAVVPETIRLSGVSIARPIMSDFTVTASGKAVTPTAISVAYASATLTVPKTDQPVEYSVSYRGGDPVVANTTALSTAPTNVKVGQNFNIISGHSGSPDYWFDYAPNNDPITLIQQVGVPAGSPADIGSGGYLVSTFQATQTGTYKVQYTNFPKTKTIDYIINVN